jgi:ectoine hydroxylase-related dioxygenase (phytanoyl-CoA dioxygenase family)
MLGGLLESQVEQYRREGFLFPIRVLSAEEAEASRLSLHRVAKECDLPLARLPMPHMYFRWAYDLAAHPPVLREVERVLGPDLLVWGTLVLSKEARSRAMVPWHQDGARAPFLRDSPSVSVWIALTPVTAENGCLRVIPASHGALLPFSGDKGADDMLKRGQRVQAEIDEAAAVDIELMPGEASMHDDRLIHGSNPNRSDGPRTGFIIRYATPAIGQPELPVYCVQGSACSIDCRVPPPKRETEECYRDYAAFCRAESGVKN